MNSAQNPQQTEAILAEMLKWVKVSSFSSVEDILVRTLTTPKDRTIYQMWDGHSTVADIKKRAGVGYKKISDLSRKCVSIGLAVEINGKIVRQFDLNDFGLLPENSIEEEGSDV